MIMKNYVARANNYNMQENTSYVRLLRTTSN